MITLYLQDLMEYSSDDAQTLRSEIGSRIDDLQRHLEIIHVDNCRFCYRSNGSPETNRDYGGT